MSYPEEAKINKLLINKVVGLLKEGRPEKRIEIKDPEIKGFRLRIEQSGHISYYLYTRIGKGRTAPQVFVHLGSPPMTPEQARESAKLRKSLALQGQDPRLEKIDDDKNPTLGAITEMFLQLHSRAHKCASEIIQDTSKAKKVIKFFGSNKRIRSFERADIIAFHNSRGHAPYAGNRYLAFLSKMFNFCEDMGKRDPNSNPCRRVKKFKEHSRERPLEMEELERLGERLNFLEETRGARPHAIALMRMLIFSGRRLGDILQLERPNMDWERSRYRKLTKGGDYEWLQFNSHCIDILKNIPEVEGNHYFFASEVLEGTHMRHPTRFYNEKIRPACNIKDVRIHDLRHTHATIARACNMDLGLVGKLLGHKSHLTTKRYAHVYDMEHIQATEHVGNVIHAVFGKGAGDVTGVQQAMEAIKKVINKGNINPIALAQLVTAIQNLAPSSAINNDNAGELAHIITAMISSAGNNSVISFPTIK